MIEADIKHKDEKIIWNEDLEASFKDLNKMISSETLMNYTECEIVFTGHTDAYDK